ncbi:MAG: BatD family protein [Gemmatimonadota bacterium]
MIPLLLALLVGVPGGGRAAERPVSLQQSVAVESSLNQTTIAAGSTVVLQLRIRTEGERPQIEPLVGLPAGLRVVHTRSSDQRQFSLPGGTRRFVSRDYVLLARQAGRFRIPPLAVVVGAHRYQTRPLVLTVEQGEGAPAQPRDDVTLRTWLNTDTAYVGQQVTFHAEATFGDEVRLRLRRAPEYEAPNPTGFWVQELPGSPESNSRIVGSSIYEVQTFQRALFPVAAGEQVIPPAHLSYEVRRGLMNAPETREVLSDTLRLVVLPVPSAGRPAGFTGAVGRYSASARLEPGRVSAGEAAVLSVTVDGVGNKKALPAPALPALQGVQVFPPTEDASVDVVEGHVRGRKRFEWVLIPDRAGTLEVPAIRYPFFDPEQRRFLTASTAPLALDVQPAAVADGTAPPPSDDRLRYLKLEPAPSPLRWTLTPWFGALQVTPLLGLFGMFLVRRRRRADRRPGRRSLARRRRQLVDDLRAPTRMEAVTFFRELNHGVRAWLAERLDRRLNGSPESLVAPLQDAGVAEDVARGLADLLARLQRAAYEPTPPSSESRRVYLQAAERLLESVDRQASWPADDRVSSTAPVLLALVLPLATLAALAMPALAGASPQAVVAPEASRPASESARLASSGPDAQPAADARAAFRQGIAAFQANDTATALAAFRRYTTARPADPAGWYDLGNAYQAVGDRGQAIRAWLEALSRAPRDPDVLNNLRVAGADPALVDRVRPLPPLAPEESMLLASLCWLLGGTALLLYMRRRRAYLVTLASVLVTAAVVVGGIAAAHAMAPELAVVTGPDAALRATPNLRGDPLVALDPGDGLRIVQRHDGWWRVRTLAGRDGWVEAAMLTELGG